MSDFLRLPEAPALRLENLTLADMTRASLTLAGGRIVADAPGAVAVDLGGALVLPGFVDMHTHLDKGHIWPRSPNPDGTFMGALDTVRADSTANWSAGDVRARMDFALRCAFAHGTRAIRTHLDSAPPQDDISWSVFREMRAEWRGRIEVQAACLVGCERVSLDGPFARTAGIVAASGGVLGMVTYPVAGLDAQIDAFFRLAMTHDLDIDFHVDETLEAVNTLALIARKVIDTGFARPVTVGHLCSLSTMPPDEAERTLDLVAQAGLNVVSLPMCNLYLQDRQRGRTPRYRGVTLVHELKARGVNVSFASDNTRDPFYAYGDLDMVEVLREATRIGHLDHADADWHHAFAANPARACGFDAPSLAPGAPADLVIFRARSWNELLARPQSDRIVLRGGRAIDRTLPDYSELDPLMGRK